VIRSFYLVHAQDGNRTCTKHKVHARSMFKGFFAALLIRSCAQMQVQKLRPIVQNFGLTFPVQSILISILFPSGSRTQVERPFPFDPLFTSAGEGSIPLRLNVAMTS